MKHVLWVAGTIALIPGIWFFLRFIQHDSGQGSEWLVYSGIFFGVSLVCWAVFFFIQFREEGQQDISITKF
jgi:hypothetical protein